MNKVRSLLTSLAIVTISVVATPLTVVHADNPHGDLAGSLQTFLQPNTSYFWNSGTIDLKGLKRDDLFRFVSDVRNDVFWWPGVVSVDLASGDGTTGTVYNEHISYGSITLLNPVVIDAWKQNHYEVEETVGLVRSWGLLTFRNTDDGASLTLTGTLPQSPLLTKEVLKEQTFFALESLANYYHTTGTITYSDGDFVTPASVSGFIAPFSIDVKNND